ncbi:MAG: ABC transporter permease, partial [Chloroflexota bacterium]|nr:ABC transporter permease [Chloroflexota bacterium]
RRILLLVPLMIGLSMVVFVIIHLSPGDPALAFASEQALDPQVLAQVRENLGLDKPLPVQYGIWLSHVARFEFGTAYTFNRKPVINLIGERVLMSVQLQALALVMAVLIAIPLGIISAKRQYSLLDNLATGGAFLGLALPDFWLALMLQLLLAVQLGWLPASTSGPGTAGLEKLSYFIMPAVVLAVPIIAIFIRFMRSSMLEVNKQDYVTTARAKGLSERAVTYRHILKNAIVPMVTVIGIQLPRLVSGAVIVETVFAWPGLGWLGYQAILQRDYPVILALSLLTGAFILVMNVVVDIVYALLDPRIRFD